MKRRIRKDLERDGYVVLPDLLDPDEVAGLRAALDPHLAEGPEGRNPFEGYRTQRVYSLVVKSRAFDRLVLDPTVLPIAEHVLGENLLLTASLAINIEPGQPAQDLHWDDAFYPLPRPRPPVSVSVMWAITDFTAENGATVLLPGSHTWSEDEMKIDGREPVPAEMTAGSALLHFGTLVHGGGANESDADRLGVSIQYAAPWARQQENFTLALGLDGARELPERLRELVGYSIHPPFMGMVDGRHPRKLLD